MPTTIVWCECNGFVLCPERKQFKQQQREKAENERATEKVWEALEAPQEPEDDGGEQEAEQMSPWGHSVNEFQRFFTG